MLLKVFCCKPPHKDALPRATFGRCISAAMYCKSESEVSSGMNLDEGACSSFGEHAWLAKSTCIEGDGSVTKGGHGSSFWASDSDSEIDCAQFVGSQS